MEKKGPDSVIDCSYHSLGTSVLLRSVRTRKSDHNTIGREEVMKVGIVVLATIIALKGLDGGVKLRFNKSREVSER